MSLNCTNFNDIGYSNCLHSYNYLLFDTSSFEKTIHYCTTCHISFKI